MNDRTLNAIAFIVLGLVALGALVADAIATLHGMPAGPAPSAIGGSAVGALAGLIAPMRSAPQQQGTQP